VASGVYHNFLQDGPYASWLELFGGAFLLIIGVANLRKAILARGGSGAAPLPDQTVSRSRAITRPARDFALGAFLCGSNPAFLMFWVYATKKIEEHTGIDIDGSLIFAFLGGICLGDAVWFKVLTTVVRRGQRTVRPRALRFVSSGIAAVF